MVTLTRNMHHCL